MTIHVGMEPYSGIISYYNGVENIINSGIKHVEKDHIRKASIMYEMLKLKADGKQLGCACVFLSENYDNEIRKRFIEEGFKVGFKIVEIINIATAIYLTTMSQINYNPLNGNVIWINWVGHFYVWQIIDQKAKFINRLKGHISKVYDWETIINESNENNKPDVLIHTGDMDKKILSKKLSPNCQIFVYNFLPHWHSRSSLLKARITSGELRLAHLRVLNFLSKKVTLKISDKEIVSFKYGHYLPISYSHKLSKQSNNDVLKIILSDLCTTEKSITLSKADKIDFEFKIDENEIYSVFFKSADKNIKSPTPTMPTPTTYKKTSTAVKGVNESDLIIIPPSENNTKISNIMKSPTPAIPPRTASNKRTSNGVSGDSEKDLVIIPPNNNGSKISTTLKSPTPAIPPRTASNKVGFKSRFLRLFTSSSTNQYKIPTKITLSNSDVLGIDLGTSRCCAAVNRINGITPVPLDNKGETLLPSYVAYDEKNVKCGNVVVHRLRYFSKSTIFDSKRIIGRSLDDIEIDEKWPFILFYENNEVYMQIDAFNGKRKLKAEQIAADLLKHIKLKSEDFQGFPLNKVVITVPAAFTEAQKNATMEAAKLAGFKNIKLLPEPVAAAAAYFINRPMTKNPNVFLLDLGGGTLDICVFKVENDKIKVISNTGDSKLGSANFDTILINYFKSVLDSKYGISASKDKKYKLMLASQRIKEDLTSITNISLDVEEIDISKEGQIVISREEFERMAKPLLNKIRNTIQSALYISKYDANQIDKV